MFERTGLIALGLLILTFSAAADLSIEVSDPAPLAGDPFEIVVLRDGSPVPGASVEAVYRPNSQTVTTELVGMTGPDGALTFSPVEPGIVNLTASTGEGEAAESVTRSISVRFGGFPIPGIMIMIFAGIILFGGAALGMKNLLTEGPIGEEVLEEEPPST